ncbi:signal peptidase I [Sphingomicrobium flavum]|uniref:signal peptidase I n=1 Tax=Sphingomicrobium flavum TaxID=1229164 RepID=UPI0021ADAF8A|nr:signal peptidase I [Sphingomicrobium flavum]
MKEYGRLAWAETKGMFWVLLAVLGVHSFIAKPFYIPSESMMPILLTGDRLVVTKYPYGYSFVSPTIPNPVGIVQALVPGGEPGGWTVTLPPMEGRLFGSMPKRGDVVIVTPRGKNEDYIKRVIGLPGDTIEVDNGHLVINGEPVLRERADDILIPVDENSPCGRETNLLNYDTRLVSLIVTGEDGRDYCALPIVRETLPNGVSYDTVELGQSDGDDYDMITVPEGHVFLMGDNRDMSSDSRFPADEPYNGLGGAMPVEHIGGRAEFITFSLDGSTGWNPATWWSSLRDGRAGNSLRTKAAEAAE